MPAPLLTVSGSMFRVLLFIPFTKLFFWLLMVICKWGGRSRWLLWEQFLYCADMYRLRNCSTQVRLNELLCQNCLLHSSASQQQQDITQLLASAARQSLFSVILFWSIYQRLSDSGCTQFYSQCIVPVSLICLPVVIYPPFWRYIADIGVWDLAAPANKRLSTLSSYYII